MRKFLKNTILLITVLGVTVSCNSPSKDISFYHWKTNLDLDDVEILLFKEVNASKLYSKFFDVSWVK